MAIFKALTFDGVNSLDYGIYITGEAVYNAPERAVEMVNIPGKNGALALDQGRFENIEVTYHAGCFADSQADFADKVMKFRNALASRYTYKRLTDEYHPDEYRLGLYKSGLEVDAVRYSTAGEFNITFDCKPQRFLVDGDREILPTEWSDVQTESGELVTIESDGSLAVKSLEVSLSPIQSLNGYDSPWVGGAGKNLFYINPQTSGGITVTLNGDGSYKLNGSATNAVFLRSNSYNLKAGQYRLSASSSSPSGYYVRIRNADNLALITTMNADGGNGVNVSISEDTNVFWEITVFANTTLSNVNVYPQLEKGSVKTAFEPYTNICPISGHTSVETHRAGKNLLPAIERTSTSNGITAVVNTNDWTVTLNGSNPSGTSWVNIDFASNASSNVFDVQGLVGVPLKAVWDDAPILTLGNMTFQVGAFTADAWRTMTSVYKTRPIVEFSYQEGDLYGRSYLQIPQGNSFNNLTIRLPMICLASDSNKVEPYNGTTYTTALGRTVYGGTLDVVSGVLTVDRASITIDGDVFSLFYNGQYSTGNTEVRFTPTPTKANGATNLIADRFRIVNYTSAQAEVGMARGNPTRNFIYFCVPPTVTSKAEAIAYFQANPTQVCYPLATPQTYQLTPQQIDLLLGTNHLWSDGEITVTYGVHPYYNPTPFASRPLIKVTGTGTLGIGEYILTITGTASQTLYIDCETMEIYTLEGTVPTGASSLVSINRNDFPVLEPGTNYISVGSGITAVTITPRWWRI